MTTAGVVVDKSIVVESSPVPVACPVEFQVAPTELVLVGAALAEVLRIKLRNDDATS
jgi:hypothetical protein